METKHTPTPWQLVTEKIELVGESHIIKSDDKAIAILPAVNAETALNGMFIVDACNAHDELVAAAKRAVEHIKFLDGSGKVIFALNAAIAKAEGKNGDHFDTFGPDDFSDADGK